MTNAFKAVPITLLCAAALVGSNARAGVVTVDAALNSSRGGSAVTALELVAGQRFHLSTGGYQTWSAGELLSRESLFDNRTDVVSRSTSLSRSNANGVTGRVYAQAGDNSEAAAGTLIGHFFGLYGDDFFAAPYASLVAQIGDGERFVVGTDFSGVATSSGALRLMFWDANASGNSGRIDVLAVAEDRLAVPEPGSAALAAVALGALALSRRRGRA